MFVVQVLESLPEDAVAPVLLNLSVRLRSLQASATNFLLNFVP